MDWHFVLLSRDQGIQKPKRKERKYMYKNLVTVVWKYSQENEESIAICWFIWAQFSTQKVIVINTQISWKFMWNIGQRKTKETCSKLFRNKTKSYTTFQQKWSNRKKKGIKYHVSILVNSQFPNECNTLFNDSSPFNGNSIFFCAVVVDLN